jgi:uncharacterized protein
MSTTQTSKCVATLSASVAVLATLLSSGAFAQSFDCAPYLANRQAPETVICETPQLQSLDEAMASIYSDLMGRLSRRAAESLRGNQRNWLAARDSCGFNANCLVSRYNQRIRDLNNY